MMYKEKLTLSREEIHQAFRQAVLSLTPYKNGSCKEAGCKGVVVKKVIGRIPCFLFYNTPQCTVCGKVYLNTHVVVS